MRLLLAVLICAAACAPTLKARPLDDAVQYATARLQASGVPGFAIAITHRDEVLWVRGYGRADATGRTVTADTPFVLGSTSKSFTALAIMKLVENGTVALDAAVRRYLPGFLGEGGAGSAITVRQLLNQTSGLSHEAGDQPIFEIGPVGTDAIRQAALALHPNALNRPAGSSFEYSNANYVVLGAIVEAAAGMPFEQYLRENVLAPLNMANTFADEAAARAHGLAAGHRAWLGSFEQSEVPYLRRNKSRAAMARNIAPAT